MSHCVLVKKLQQGSMAVHFVIASFVLALIANWGGFPVHVHADDVSVDTLLSCKVGDMFCNSECTAVVLCISNNEQYVVTNCTVNTLSCDTASLTCKAAADATCKSPPDQNTLKCHAAGNFPNPYDCHSYFNCDPTSGDDVYAATGTLVPCPGTTAYDPLAEDCRLLSTDRVCTVGPVPSCSTAGQNGPVERNPNIYYVCVNDTVSSSLVPWLFKCANITQEYVDGQCQEGGATAGATTSTTAASTSTSAALTTSTSAASTTSTTTAPTSTTAASTSTTETPTTSTSAATTTSTTAASTTTPYYCFQPGTTVPDPADCRSYYLCTSNMQQIHYTCRTGYYYDKRTAYCLKGSCSN